MMWNLLVSGLLAGATVVLFDGSPGHPDLGALWRLAERTASPGSGRPRRSSVVPARPGCARATRSTSRALRAVGSTGSPLSAEGFRWIGDAIGEHVQICSVSGGTDMCTAFVGGAPTRARCGWASCRARSWAPRPSPTTRPAARSIDEVGELVLTSPMPSMPVSFWNDPDGTRLHEAYFDAYPGVWRHGDWVRVTPRGSYVIYGRSDSTLNRGGVRMGTAEFYAVVEGFAEVADSLVIDTSELGAHDEGELLCFLVLAPGADLAEVEPRLRRALRAELSPGTCRTGSSSSTPSPALSTARSSRCRSRRSSPGSPPTRPSAGMPCSIRMPSRLSWTWPAPRLGPPSARRRPDLSFPSRAVTLCAEVLICRTSAQRAGDAVSRRRPGSACWIPWRSRW